MPPPAPYARTYTLVSNKSQGTKQTLTKPGQEPSLPTCFVAGAAAGAGYWGLFYPLDTIKTRMQVGRGGVFVDAWPAEGALVFLVAVAWLRYSRRVPYKDVWDENIHRVAADRWM